MHDAVKNYYANVLEGSADLQTDACSTDEGLPEFVKPILGKVHDEVMKRYYGCGLIIPEQLDGLSVLDLGCGAGRDASLPGAFQVLTSLAKHAQSALLWVAPCID